MISKFTKCTPAYIFFLIFFVIGCSNQKYDTHSSNIEQVLKQTKQNRIEIEKALDYFISQEDSLKIKAVFFLVENMADKYSVIPESTDDPFQKIILTNNRIETEAWEPAKSQIGLAFDSIYQRSSSAPKTKIIRDIDFITADFLINNIEKAFEVWSITQSFTKCSFEDFCEYILPYRIGREPLNDWRKEAYDKFSFLLDSLQDPIEIAKAVVKHAGMHYNAGMNKYPHSITFMELDNLHWGSCDHLSHYLTLSLRAIGIPASIDIVPAWANRSAGHVWNVVMDKNGNFKDFGFNAEGSNGILYKIPKIYRTTFSTNESRLFYLNPAWKDVTGEYSLPTSDIVLPKPDKHKGSLFFLCTFNNREWIPIAVSQKPDKEQIVFHEIARGIPFDNHQIAGYQNEGKGIVFLPAYLVKNTLTTFSDPVILRENGETYSLSPNHSVSQTIILHRKYPKYGQFTAYVSRITGGFFEISNHKNFSKKEIIHTIKERTEHAISEVPLSKTATCRYIRYMAPDNSWINMSELQFFYKDKRLDGIPFASNPNRTHNELAAICDNNIDTYYAAEAQNAFIGLDFGKEVNIDKIMYAPRTDGNDIIPGEEYELFYWDKKWVSMGRKTADKFYLEYSEVPGNILLLLHNHTKGVEERIFTYENNEQIWW